MGNQGGQWVDSKRVGKLHQVRLMLRGELEAPPALRRFGSGWISGVLGFGLSLVLRPDKELGTPRWRY